MALGHFGPRVIRTCCWTGHNQIYWFLHQSSDIWLTVLFTCCMEMWGSARHPCRSWCGSAWLFPDPPTRWHQDLPRGKAPNGSSRSFSEQAKFHIHSQCPHLFFLSLPSPNCPFSQFKQHIFIRRLLYVFPTECQNKVTCLGETVQVLFPLKPIVSSRKWCLD